MTAARLRVLGLAGVAGLLLVGPWLARPAPRLLLNTTASAPIGLYGVDQRSPRIGDLVVFQPPPSLANWMARRGYLPANVPLLKVLAAAEGQQVCGRAGRITIDGRFVAVARRQDRRGRALRPFEGCRRLAAGEIFLLNADAPASLDGRYFGPVSAARVIGRAMPLWTAAER